MDTFERIKKVIADSLDVKESEITLEKSLTDLGADSLDAVDTIMTIEKEFNIAIPDTEMEKMITVNDIVEYVKNNTKP